MIGRKGVAAKCAFVLFLLALDWAALHDVLSDEPDLSLEYGIVAVTVVVFLAMIIFGVKKRLAGQ